MNQTGLHPMGSTSKLFNCLRTTKLNRNGLTSSSSSSSILKKLQSFHHQQSFQFSSSQNLSVKYKAQKREVERQRMKSFQAQKDQKVLLSLKRKPDPILGYSTSLPKDYLNWENCELKKLILKNEDVWSGKVTTGEAQLKGSDDGHESNKLLNFGLTEENKELLFEALPAVTSQKSVLESTSFEAIEQERQENSAKEENSKKESLSRILDLRNANAKGIDKVNKQRIVQAFSPTPGPGQPQKLDPGCSEVQAAITTYRIHSILEHAWANTRDVDSRRHLTSLVMLRMKILKYLKRTEPTRYHKLLPRIGLDNRYLKDELIVRSKLPPRPGEQLD